MRLGMIMFSVLLVFPAISAELTLRVQGENLNGKEVRVGLYSSAQGFPRKDEDAMRMAKADAPNNEITPNEVIFCFSDLPPGEYAVAAFTDINRNAKLDSNFLGIPTEPYGFSRDARGLMGPPSFSEAAFRIGNTNVTQTFRLQ